jgi:hypothetical protein
MSFGALSSFISPSSVRALARSNPSYNQNRERAAVVLHDGFSTWDTYVEIRPALFVLSLMGMVGSAWVGYNRRDKGWESVALYSTGFVASAVTAWITRPGAFGGAATASEEEAQAGGGMVGYLDNRAQEIKLREPNFVDVAFTRLIRSPGVAPSWQKIDPVIQAVVV